MEKCLSSYSGFLSYIAIGHPGTEEVEDCPFCCFPAPMQCSTLPQATPVSISKPYDRRGEWMGRNFSPLGKARPHCCPPLAPGEPCPRLLPPPPPDIMVGPQLGMSRTSCLNHILSTLQAMIPGSKKHDDNNRPDIRRGKLIWING